MPFFFFFFLRKVCITMNFPLRTAFPASHALYYSMKVKVAQSYPTLCDPIDYIVHGILQARILAWVVFPFSRGSSQPRDQTQSILKQINPEYSSEGLMLKLQYFGHLMGRADSLEKTLMLGRIEGRRRKRRQKTR